MPLSEVADQLSVLPENRAPDHDDWNKIAPRWSGEINRRIRMIGWAKKGRDP
ncbi:hypothetical protein GCM10007920_44890 [Ciceribacter naphthalenivorans]|uniref:Transposase n=2 Tax=Alphaproteobacteria TaxID=28211 RepID=A0A512HFC9_9HYPH|nr:hypothetical protein RNA01_10910 [Ciceribacter naphthalenivorans]GLR24695.1 hypothetical protein GCM10007920_44890 [Ciceribacter naphthalenivorans]GLT07551.1 hypothetical protein GCM10007926_44890 [Sphingomonas psychrolutea]